jgi:hypothetical protein
MGARRNCPQCGCSVPVPGSRPWVSRAMHWLDWTGRAARLVLRTVLCLAGPSAAGPFLRLWVTPRELLAREAPEHLPVWR